MPSRFTVAVVQTAGRALGDAANVGQTMRDNVQAMVRVIHALHANGDGPGIIVFPVVPLSGSGAAMLFQIGKRLPTNPEEVAINFIDGDARLEPLIEACREHGCYIGMTALEKITRLPGKYFHTGAVLGPEGVVLRSPKTQAPTSPTASLLRDAYAEYLAAVGGQGILPVVETPYGRLGLLVEGEALVAEASRTLGRRGAEIILHPTVEHAVAGAAPYPSIRRSMAYMNSVYWLSAAPSREIVTHEGRTVEHPFAGGSQVVSPEGTVIAGVEGVGEGYACAQIDLEWAATVRQQNEPRVNPVNAFYRDLFRE